MRGRADTIALSSSGDGGRTWTKPVNVNTTPANIPSGTGRPSPLR